MTFSHNRPIVQYSKRNSVPGFLGSQNIYTQNVAAHLIHYSWLHFSPLFVPVSTIFKLLRILIFFFTIGFLIPSLEAWYLELLSIL